MNIAIIGLGLIGGSVARALAASGRHHITGITRSQAVLAAAMDQGCINSRDEAELTKADVVYCCLYPDAAIKYIIENASRFKPGAIVTDACGIKAKICAALEPVALANGFVFVGSHPMAGKEVSGFWNSDASLFNGASYIMTPADPESPAVAILSGLANEMGFARFVMTTPAEHDRMIAYTSQLPHVLACAYVLNPLCKNHGGFSAGSFRDVSRVAKINEALWSELFIENSDALCEQIDALTAKLRELESAVRLKDENEVKKLLRTGREIKEGLEI